MIDGYATDDFVMPAQVHGRRGPLTLAQQDAQLYLVSLEDAAGALARCARAQEGKKLTALVNAMAWFDDPDGELTLEARTIPLTFGDTCRALRLDPDEYLAIIRRNYRQWHRDGVDHKHWSRVGMTRRRKAA